MEVFMTGTENIRNFTNAETWPGPSQTFSINERACWERMIFFKSFFTFSNKFFSIYPCS